MTDKKDGEAEVKIISQDDEDGAFDSGFDPTKKVEVRSEDEPPKDEPPKDEPPKDEPPKEPPKEEPPGDDSPVTLTKKQFELLMANVEHAAELKKSFEKLTGTIGVQRQEIDNLKKSGVQVGDDDVEAELKALTDQFPEMAAAIKGGLKNLFKKTVGRAPATGMSEEDMQKRIVDTVNKRELEAMDDAHPDWREIVRARTDGQPTPYRAWLATKSEAYRNRVTGTEVASVLIRAIDQFKRDAEAAERAAKDAEAEKAKAEAGKEKDDGTGAGARAARLKAGITPKGDGRGPEHRGQKTETEDDGFDAGYKESRPRVTH